LRQFLGFIGISDAEFVHAEGLDLDADTREKGSSAAHFRIAALLDRAAMAA
jgi:FMN-dependent NADH-azoreductase